MNVTLWIPAVLVINLVLGGLLMIGVFSFMERRVSLGALGGIVVGTGVIYTQATLGEEMLQVTVGEMKLLVIAASLGAVIGVVGTVLAVEPDL
ncbi:uncharacterized protein Nmlp_2540 [Natronomonas moolapensis 8.8.11]|uniref:Uncharacterized protein n=1 Tax=Natronomonas moolapensis (strain DSM 18674 / CECT 7526 / JCM 14361 / 8.8.11) TaxID=268739 RepID=M1XR58_NATM8|nr:hypothetical protein [Natronomonas moolapensis]CCQ36702.1 uncharacterized protein Nmlp_2540 [Natronomonas moolapensis 8.8.11]